MWIDCAVAVVDVGVGGGVPGRSRDHSQEGEFLRWRVEGSRIPLLSVII